MRRLLVQEEISWVQAAKCKGQTELFFGITKEKQWIRLQREKAAVAICQGCPSILQCRQYARENNELGVWGGETEEERFAAGFLRNDDIKRRLQARVKRAKIANAG